MDWEPYINVVRSVIGGSQDDLAKVRNGIVSDFGEDAWKVILMEIRERMIGEKRDVKSSTTRIGRLQRKCNLNRKKR